MKILKLLKLGGKKPVVCDTRAEYVIKRCSGKYISATVHSERMLRQTLLTMLDCDIVLITKNALETNIIVPKSHGKYFGTDDKRDKSSSKKVNIILMSLETRLSPVAPLHTLVGTLEKEGLDIRIICGDKTYISVPESQFRRFKRVIKKFKQ